MAYKLDYEKDYWDALMALFNNEYGVAGLMGNLKAESGLLPYRKQGDYTSPYDASISYTEKVDAGQISENSFVNDSIGYGVAQWTWYTRKQKLFDLHESMHVSIGDFDLSIEMLKHELLQDGGYADVGNYLKNVKNVRDASNYVLHNYEAPKDQSESVENARYDLSIELYNKFSGSTPEPPEPGASKKKMPLWMYILK